MEPQKYRNPGTVPDAERAARIERLVEAGANPEGAAIVVDTPAAAVRTITLRDAVEEIRKLADAQPDTVAGGYLAQPFASPYTKPHAVCIVGHAYADWGIPLADLALWENAVGAERWLPGTGPEGDGGPVDFLNEYGLRFTAAAAAFLRKCQKLQDSGIRWGTVFHTMLGRAHVVFGTELHDEGDLYEHGEPLDWPQLTPRVVSH